MNHDTLAVVSGSQERLKYEEKESKAKNQRKEKDEVANQYAEVEEEHC